MPVSDRELPPRGLESSVKPLFTPWRLFPWFRTSSGSPTAVSLSKQQVVRPVLEAIDSDDEDQSQPIEAQNASRLGPLGTHVLLEAERVTTEGALRDALLAVSAEPPATEGLKKTSTKKQTKDIQRKENTVLQVPQLQDQLRSSQLPKKPPGGAISLSPLAQRLAKQRRSKHKLSSEETPNKRYKKYKKTRSAILINPESESEDENENTTVPALADMVLIEDSTEVEEVDDSDASNYNNPLPITSEKATSFIVDNPDLTAGDDPMSSLEHELSRPRLPVRDVSTQTPTKSLFKKTLKPHLTEKERKFMDLVQKSDTNSQLSSDIEEDAISNSSPKKAIKESESTSISAPHARKHRAPSISKPNLVEALHRLDTNTPDYILRGEELTDKQPGVHNEKDLDSSFSANVAHELQEVTKKKRGGVALFVDSDSSLNIENTPRKSTNLKLSQSSTLAESLHSQTQHALSPLSKSGKDGVLQFQYSDEQNDNFEPAEEVPPKYSDKNPVFAPDASSGNESVVAPKVEGDSHSVSDSDGPLPSSKATTSVKGERRVRATASDEDSDSDGRKDQESSAEEGSPKREYLKFPSPTPLTADGRIRHKYIMNLGELLVEQGRQGASRKNVYSLKKRRPKRPLLRKTWAMDEEEVEDGEPEDEESEAKPEASSVVVETSSEDLGVALEEKEAPIPEKDLSTPSKRPSRGKKTPKKKEAPEGAPSGGKESLEVKDTPAAEGRRRTRSSTKGAAPFPALLGDSYMKANFDVDKVSAGWSET